MDHDGPDGVASSSTAHLAASAPPTAAASTSVPPVSSAQQRKEARGRKRNDDLPPSRAREVQRAFRARRAAHLAALEDRVKEVEAENAVLRKQLNLPPANREPIRAGPTGRGKILDPSSVASSPGGGSAIAGGSASRSRGKRSATAAGGDDFDDDSDGLGSGDDSELGQPGSARPLKRQASDTTRASPSLLASLNGGSGSPADFGLLGGGGSGNRTPSIDPPGSGRSFASFGGGSSVPIHLTSPFPSLTSNGGSPLLDRSHQQLLLQQQQQQQQAAFLSQLGNGANAFSNGGSGNSPSALPPMTDEQIFFYQQHLAQQQAQNTAAAAALAVANAKTNNGSGKSSALGPFGFGGNGGGSGYTGASGMSSHGHSPLNTSFELLQQQQHALQQQQQQQHAAQQQQQQFQQQLGHHQHQQQHHPLASLLAITTPQTMASSPYNSFSPSSFNSFSGTSGGGNGLSNNGGSVLGGLHSSNNGGGLRSHVSSPHSTHSSGFGPTPPATRPSFNETDAMFRLRMCCKLDDRLVSSDPGCLAFCQAVVSSLGVTHADCLALPHDQDDQTPAIVGANGDSPGHGIGGGSGLGATGSGGFDPITPRSPLGKATVGSSAFSGRYVPLLAVWAVLRPAFPLGHDGGIREAMEAGTRAARFLIRSAQDEARTSTASNNVQRPNAVQAQTSAGKPWLCGEWIQCRSSNGVEVHTGFLQSLTDRLGDNGGNGSGLQQRLSLGGLNGGQNGASGLKAGPPSGSGMQQQVASTGATSLSTPQTEPSPASTTHPSPQVPVSASGAGPPGSEEERIVSGGGGGGSSSIGPYGS